MKGKSVTELHSIHIEMLRRFAQGETNEAVMQNMHFRSKGTVSYYQAQATRILGALNLSNAIYIASKRGLI